MFGGKHESGHCGDTGREDRRLLRNRRRPSLQSRLRPRIVGPTASSEGLGRTDPNPRWSNRITRVNDARRRWKRYIDRFGLDRVDGDERPRQARADRPGHRRRPGRRCPCRHSWRSESAEPSPQPQASSRGGGVAANPNINGGQRRHIGQPTPVRDPEGYAPQPLTCAGSRSIKDPAASSVTLLQTAYSAAAPVRRWTREPGPAWPERVIAGRPSTSRSRYRSPTKPIRHQSREAIMNEDFQRRHEAECARLQARLEAFPARQEESTRRARRMC